MFMALVFGLNQVLSHGFGLFLFAAMVPVMRDDLAINHWHLALVGALTQIAYLVGAFLLGLIGHRVGAFKLSIMTGICTSVLLLSLSLIEDVILIITILTLMAASAAISWGSIVGVISRFAKANQYATYLTTASSGTAWGYAINGAMILFVVPQWGWQMSWLIASIYGVLVVLITLYLLYRLNHEDNATKAQNLAQDISATELHLRFKPLMETMLQHPVALMACVICLLVGLTTMPFANWLNTYLTALALPAEVGGYTWAIAGACGMFAGFLVGKFADIKGYAHALLFIFASFFICTFIFLMDVTKFAPIAGFGYGMMYFPMWGIIAGWIGQCFNATQSMQISGICMVTFGVGGAAGNLVAGYLYEMTQSLDWVFILINMVAFLLVLLGAFILLRQKRGSPSLICVR